jgi:hypothetical protein
VANHSRVAGPNWLSTSSTPPILPRPPDIPPVTHFAITPANSPYGANQ